ncbi:MAG: 16S rRNA (cytosine(967)-C(5))-methyltransferase RsmB [Bacillota bacterium]|nr:16S rRNA (cytosine(967)-C(5))-methyltransferase RsmB [Bacillota bacterium]
MTARQLALQTLVDGHYVSDRLHAQCERHHLSDADRRLYMQLVLGVVENKLLLDYYISRISSTKLSKMDPEVLWILRLGIYQIRFTEIPDFAAVNESVNLAKMRLRPQLVRFVNGVLRSYLRQPEIPLPKDPVERMSLEYSHPKWIVRMWEKRYGLAFTASLLQANNQTPSLSLRVNTSRTSIADFERRLVDAGIRAHRSDLAETGVVIDDLAGHRLTEIPGFADGDFIVQDEASQQVVNLWKQRGTIVPDSVRMAIDVCSAPGGKTTHLLETLKVCGNSAEVQAFDIHPRKLLTVVENAERLRLEDALRARLVDALEPDSALFETADLILVDAPCSGLGIIRKKPEIRFNRTENDMETLAALQKSILSNASKYAKIGSNLLYSTCTISETENQHVVAGFLSENPDFRLIEEREYFPHLHGCDGFYIALLEKTR